MEEKNKSNVISERLQVRIKFHYSPLIFIIDQIIRITLFVLYIQDYVSIAFFLVAQFILFLIVAFHHDWYEKKIHKKYGKYINPIYEAQNPELIFEDNIPVPLLSYQALAGFIFSFWFFYDIFDNHYWYHYIIILVLTFIGTVICLFPLTFAIKYHESKGVLTARAIMKREFWGENGKKFSFQNVSKNYPNVFTYSLILDHESLELDPIDTNDARIAKLESEIKNINHKSEAWMLESVFLGGLSFSSFLTVASANFLGAEPTVFSSFIEHSVNYFTSCQSIAVTSWLIQLETHFVRSDLYILIMLLCLMSSVFFLLVLTLRLRLNSLSLNMDHLIRILIIFNAKEEELFNLKLEEDKDQFQLKRLEKISRKVEIALVDAESLLKQLKPTSVMMSVYRNFAVFLFYLVLIICGFYFMPIVAFLILSLALFTQIFRLFETYSKIEVIKTLLKKH